MPEGNIAADLDTLDAEHWAAVMRAITRQVCYSHQPDTATRMSER